MYKTFDFKCSCGKTERDKMVKNGEVVTCSCGKEMDKMISAPRIGGMANLGRSGSTKLPD